MTSLCNGKPLPCPIPDHLAERCRTVGDGSEGAGDGEYVLYWMHHAVRGHENPALDLALVIANALSLPVLVYQGLGGQHRFNNDRHHAFILQGARDVHHELARRNIRHLFHLGGAAQADSPLARLAQRAAVVVTEEFPVAPFPAWTRRLQQDCGRLTLAVDCACIVPMQHHTRRYDRAFAFRNDNRDAFAKRVPLAWTEQAVTAACFDGDPGFDPVDWSQAEIAGLCAACEIDHSVPPVAHTPGGSTAGYGRWNTFLRTGIAGYARLRNDAAVEWPRGVSRISPYLHHGHVSPFRIAREAWEHGGAGAEKFLDELLVWRELAFNLCFHTDQPERLAALPAWAQETLSEHAADERDLIFDEESLARSSTGDRLWDLAQTSLRVHGELHNNLRMTWAKAILPWRPDADAALHTLVTLNHRYALDGSDPNSYGGLLWTLGLFDRPFPDAPVSGRLRQRSTRTHANRLDLDTYSTRVQQPACGRVLRIGVIGAGMAGLNAARTLQDQGHRVTVFEKSRGLGGRMATRRIDAIGLDHGAQYFTARDARFREAVAAWMELGIVQRWQPRVATVRGNRLTASPDDQARYVAVPGMSALGRHLATGLDVQQQVRVAPPRIDDGQWLLDDDAGNRLGRFDALIVAVPPEQAEALLRASVPDITAGIAQVRSDPTWALMLETSEPITAPYDALFFKDGPLAWAARNDSKPGRGGDTWVIHAGQAWTREHLDNDADTAAERLAELFCAALDMPKSRITRRWAHRWLYALTAEPLRRGAIWSAESALAVCGDWCHGSRIEGAFLSGQAAAGYLLRELAFGGVMTAASSPVREESQKCITA
jgi:photolyase PhrII